MSTIVVARKNGYAVIGADTLCTFGRCRENAEYIQDPSKIVRVGESLLAVVGSASWGLVLNSYFSSRPETDLSSCQAIFETARQMHRDLKRDYFLNPHDDDDDEFESSQLHCLIANRRGIFGLYDLRSVQQYTRFCAFGHGYAYALGAMHAVYPEASSAEVVGQAGLEAAAEFNIYTGKPLELHAVRLED